MENYLFFALLFPCVPEVLCKHHTNPKEVPTIPHSIIDTLVFIYLFIYLLIIHFCCCYNVLLFGT